LLCAASRVLQSDSTPVVVEARESRLVLDLRTTSSAAPAREQIAEPAPGVRDKIPDTRPRELIAWEDPSPSYVEDASTELAQPSARANRSVMASIGPGGSHVATMRIRRASGSSALDTNAALAAGAAPLPAASADGAFAPTPPDSGPVLAGGGQPAYPSGAQRAGQEGDVHCRLHIDEVGTVIAVEILVSSGIPRLDEAARSGLLAWRFEPATHAGSPVACTLNHTVSFRLR